MNGFSVERRPLRLQARVYDELERNARQVKNDLRAAFDRDRNTLGNDEYGAEPAKSMPGIERAVFDALEAHIEELGRVASGLNVNARNYDRADQTSDRNIVLDQATADVLKAWRKTQLEERVAWGEAWTDSGRVFTCEDGQPRKPAYVSQRFELLCDYYPGIPEAACRRRERRADRPPSPESEVVRVALDGPALPPVRFHDLRHGAATILLAAACR